MNSPLLQRALTGVAALALLALTPQTALAEDTDFVPTPADTPVERAAADRQALEDKLEATRVPTGPLTFGAEPLAAARSAAEGAAADASCAISTDEATALALAPVWPEVSAGSSLAPSPMTLSRYDNQSGLYDPAGRDGLFFNPGVGLWQMDSAGLGTDNTAGEAIDSVWVSDFVVPYIVNKYCNALNGGSAAPAARATAWADWNACRDGDCDTMYWRAFNNGIGADPSVNRYGGAEPRTCSYEGASYDCLFVDVASAQGADWWTAPGSGRSPVPHPFYVLRAGGDEVRVWLAQDSGHGVDVTVDRPFGGNARDALTWTDGRGLCDTTAGRGDC
ncbi:hypothetical protein [Nocardiopsis sp. MG754419]|uniref:hypothetical protein n=1 Tax=Nocardiopsis sp. MG754419 TaxID=2259865 RepID=UPI001BAD477A|nr:hypothetical protein [Nocardiopsis sp. MG754419]MBR8743388.1 hypothetical protein [Nocardiopsis sp. MG754419]